MGATTRKMLFSSGPNVDQAILIFSPDALCKAMQGAQPYEVGPEALADTM